MNTTFDRKEIAQALNFGKYPVLSIDMDNTYDNHADFIIGNGVRIAWDHKNPKYAGMVSVCELTIYDGNYNLSSGGCTLSSSYSVSDFIKNIEDANLPLVHRGDIVAVAHYSKKSDIKFVRMMKVSDCMDVHCSTVATLIPIED